MASLCPVWLLFCGCFVSIFSISDTVHKYLMIFACQFNMWSKKKNNTVCACAWLISKCGSFCRVITLDCSVDSSGINILNPLHWSHIRKRTSTGQGIGVFYHYLQNYCYRFILCTLSHCIVSYNCPEISNIMVNIKWGKWGHELPTSQYHTISNVGIRVRILVLLSLTGFNNDSYLKISYISHLSKKRIQWIRCEDRQ